MTPTQLRLYELLGDKTLSFGCVGFSKEGECYATYINESETSEGKMVFIQIPEYEGLHSVCDFEIIGHEPTLTDLHRWLNENGFERCYPVKTRREIRRLIMEGHPEYDDFLVMKYEGGEFKSRVHLQYDSSKKLIDQSEETLNQIISLIESNAKAS